MLVREFKHIESDLGEGFGPTWIAGADPVFEGFVAAHDCLEHFPRCIGGFEGEMMAFGAMHYVRYAIPPRNGTMWENQAADIESFLFNVLSGDQAISDPGAYRTGDLEDELNLEEGRRCIKKAMLEACRNWGSDPVANRRALPRDVVRRILGWIVKGYRKARARFMRAGVDKHEAGPLFKHLEDQWNRKVKHAEECDTIKVRVNLRRQRVDVLVVEYNDPYDY